MKTLFVIPKDRDFVSDARFRMENTIKVLGQLTELHIISLYDRAFYHKMFSEAHFIVNYAKKKAINLVWFSGGALSLRTIKKVRAKVPHLRIICDTDKASRQTLEELSLKGSKNALQAVKEVVKKEEQEKALVNLCDRVTTNTQTDVSYYQNLTRQMHKIALLSDVIDLDKEKAIVCNTKPAKSPTLFMIGDKNSATMSWAIKWVREEILPLVKKGVPNINFEVEKGYLSNSMLTHKKCDVILNVAPFALANRLKLFKAMGTGVPVVSTTLGVAGLPFKHQENIMIADTKEEFSHAIVQLIEDRSFATHIAKNALAVVKAQFSLERLKYEAKQIILGLGRYD